MNRYLLGCLGIAVLLLIFCHRLWDVAPTHTDDAIWRIAAYQGQMNIISSWATSQGRLFALVSGALIYVGTLFQGTALGSILQIGSFTIFFVAAHAMLSIYVNARMAMLAAVLNLALVAVRWEGSIVTTYPLFAWTLGSIFVASVYLGWRYSRTNRAEFHWLSLILLFVSLNIHEGVAVLFAVLAVFAVVANHDRGLTKLRGFLTLPTNGQLTKQLSNTLGVIGLYFVSYVVWRLVFPSQYDGNKFGSFNPNTVIPLLLSLSASGSVISDFLEPYAVNFADAINQDGYRIVYKPLSYLWNSSDNLTAMIAGFMVTTVICALLSWKPDTNASIGRNGRRARVWPSVLIGSAIALIPVLPVSLVGKYQEQFLNLDVRSYAFTPLCHFGWSLTLASVVCQIECIPSMNLRRAVSVLIASCFGLLAYCSTLKNDAIVADMRRETCRWAIMDQVARILPHLEKPIATLHVPRLQSGSWFTVVNSDYWSQYMQLRHDLTLRFEATAISRASMAKGLALVDYITTHGNRKPIAFAAVLDVDASSNQAVAREIAVSCRNLEPSEKAQYVLSFDDVEQGTVVRRLSELAFAENSTEIKALRNILAVPSSIRVTTHTESLDLNIECGDYCPLDAAIRFGLGTGPVKGEFGAKWLLGVWNTPERAGTWSGARSSEIRVPLKMRFDGEFTASLVASTFTGLGFYDRPQLVSVRIGDRVAATKCFTRGNGWQTIQFPVNCGELSQDGMLCIALTIDQVPNPAKLGISADTRDLGVFLQKLVFNRTPDESHRLAEREKASVR